MGSGTDHHLDFFHHRALLDHELSFLNAELAIPQPLRLAIGNSTTCTSVLSDVEFGCAIRQHLSRNWLSRWVYADRNFRLFVTRQSILEHVSKLLSSKLFMALRTFEFGILGKPRSHA